MKYYYLDIETAPLAQHQHNPNASFEPETAKIISIQYQEIAQQTGQPHSELNILKEWEQHWSEELIVGLFKKIFVDNGIWDFVPVGNNLAFDFKFLKSKLNQYFGVERRRLGQRLFVDIKHVLVIMNSGQFTGYDELLGKSHEAKNVANWYYSQQFEQIEDYIRREASGFIGKYQILLKLLPGLRPTMSSTA